MKYFDRFVRRLDGFFYLSQRFRFLQKDIPASTGWAQCMGALALTSFLLLTGTGVLLTFTYEPGIDKAWQSINGFGESLPAGLWLRSVHRISAHALMLTLGLHMLRVLVYGAYRKPRGSLWDTGVVLGLGGVLFYLTGLSLPADTLALSWASVLFANLRELFWGSTAWAGGLTGQTYQDYLIRGYLLHVFLFPFLAAVVMAVHLRAIVRLGLSRPGFDAGNAVKPLVPGYFVRLILAVSAWTAAILVSPLWISTPWGQPANGETALWPGTFAIILPGHAPNSPEVYSANWGVRLFPLLFLLFAALPWLDRSPSPHPLKRLAVLVPALSLLAWLAWILL